MANSFAQFNLKPYLVKAVAARGFREPTEIQSRVIPVILRGDSVVGQSATGSGKTHAFLLPIFSKMDPENQEAQAVITTPSRELANQIYAAAKQLNSFAPDPLRIHNYVGGSDKEHQIEQLHRHQPQLVIGTPGRTRDLVKSGDLDIHTAKMMVVDEADMTLDMGFLPQVDFIAGSLPEDLQMMVFSATIPVKLQPFLKKYMANPVMEELPPSSVINPDVDNWLMSTKGRDRNELIYTLLTMGEPYLALVFANTRERADELAGYLRNRGLKVGLLHGGLPARERKRTMREIRNLDYQYVVATDLAARGIDIDGISLVINDDVPQDLDYFVHRVGRTGRKGMEGVAITLYAPAEDDLIDQLEARHIHFVPKTIKNGRIVTTHGRNRRASHRKRHEKVSGRTKSFAARAKKKRKPGYRKKIRRAIQNDEREARVQRRRHQIRKKARARRRERKRQGR